MAATGDRYEWAPLVSQLRWLVRLRWVAGGAVIAGGLADRHLLKWYGSSSHIVAVGLFLLAYNAVIWGVLRRMTVNAPGRRLVLLLTWLQLLLDMASLTLLATWTGGAASPVLGFFVFHMVFASLLLPRAMAHGAATAAVALLGCGLFLSGQWPEQLPARVLLAGLAVTLFFTVHLANHVVAPMRRQRRRLLKKNRRIRRMTAQLRRHQRALVQHEKMVALGQMAAGVAHEISNPLANMDSLLQLMQKRPERNRPDALSTLREQIDRIGRIIAQMKNFAHPADAQPQSIALNEVVEQAIEMVTFDPRIRRVKFERKYDAQIGSIPLRPQALQQVLINLLSNALDAVQQSGEPNVTITTTRHEGYCTIDVSDSGHGIRPEDMDHLFEPFFTTKPVGQGTGLGLSISYSLVKKQGGSISVKSEIGKGTTFTVRLPMSPESSRNRESVAGGIAISEKQGE